MTSGRGKQDTKYASTKLQEDKLEDVVDSRNR